ncbi:MAG TPA: ChaN family lipoprotein, partial [Phycisphaerales bacterium]|nr:ChaN family lipoprotein [Phycisphaerales bacterium]
ALTLAMVFAALTVLSGCAGHPRAPKTELPITATQARAVTIFRGDGSRASWQDLVSATAGSEAILVGENHGHPLGLAAASALWQDVLERSPNAALAMEFWERDEQSRLDEYLSGVTDQATFLKRCARTNSNYPPGHRAMIEAAKAAHRPVIAANAPRPYVHLARTEGFERLASLSPSQQALFKIPEVLPARDSPYRKAFDDVMEAGHGAEKKDQAPPDAAAALARSERHDAGFRSQSVWDWTMAESVARSIDQGNRPTLLVVGRFHVDHHGGLVMALEHLRPDTRTTVVSFADEAAPATLPEADRGRADFVVFVGPFKE